MAHISPVALVGAGCGNARRVGGGRVWEHGLLLRRLRFWVVGGGHQCVVRFGR